MKLKLVFILITISSISALDVSQVDVSDKYLGYGWNVLTSEPTQPIYSLNDLDTESTSESSCISLRLMNDDEHHTSQDIFETYDTLNNYVSYDAKTISSKAEYDGIGGSFASQYKLIKEDVHSKNLVYLRNVNVNIRYSALLSNSCNHLLSTEFTKRINEIGSLIDASSSDNKSDADNFKHAVELVQLLVRDFGSHVVTEVKLGALLIMDMEIGDSYFRKLEATERTLSVAKQFLKFRFNYDAQYEAMNYVVSKAELNEFVNNTKSSSVFTKGAADNVYYTNLGGRDGWENSIDDSSLDVVDVDGVAIEEIIEEASEFRLLPKSTLMTIRKMIREVIKHDYDANRIIGCMWKNYRTYDFNANFHDEMLCDNIKVFENEYYYGGAFLNAHTHVGALHMTNLLTKTYSCDYGFEQIRIKDIEPYELVFCVSTQVPLYNVYFGGAYSNLNVNFVTDDQSCPDGFLPRVIGGTNTNDNVICESLETTPSVLSEFVPFGGIIFFDKFNNRLSISTPLNDTTSCSDGMQKELLFSLENNLDVYVCSAKKILTLVKLKQLPYSDFIFTKTKSLLEKIVDVAIYIIGIILIFFLVCLVLNVVYCFKKCCGKRNKRRNHDQTQVNHTNPFLENRRNDDATNERVDLIEKAPSIISNTLNETTSRRGILKNASAPPEECKICSQGMNKNDGLQSLPMCAHVFHTKCILRWLSTKKHCPVCQKQVNTRNSLKGSSINNFHD